MHMCTINWLLRGYTCIISAFKIAPQEALNVFKNRDNLFKKTLGNWRRTVIIIT